MSDLKSKLSHGGWAILTATQEAAGSWDCAQNVRDNTELVDLLTDAFDTVVLRGVYQGVDQGPSFLVFGIGELEAMELGNRFGQESILNVRGLVRCDDGTVMARANGNNTFGPDATLEDFYSTVVKTGESFSLGLDF
jgi:hypothetical protein